MLKLENVTVKFGENTVLDNLSLDLSLDKIIAITGESGCGKTTLLRVIAGELEVDSGKVLTDHTVSFMYQTPRLFPWLTALQNVNLVVGDKKETLDKSRRFLDTVGIYEHCKYPDEQSGGMQSRTALARALAFESDLLLLDEPFSALDTDNKLKMLDIVKKDGRKTILVTHDTEILKYVDRVIQLKK